MAESNIPSRHDYQSNSTKSKKEEVEVRRVPAVVQGTASVRKKSVGSKFRESFAGDDAQSVGQFLLFDVIIPSVKDLVFKMINEGSRRALFGANGKPSSSNGLISTVTNYGNMFSGGGSTILSGGGSSSTVTKPRATYDYQEIMVSSRSDGERVLDTLGGLIDEYGNATVADLYACCNMTPDHTAVKWGWRSLEGAETKPVGDGYLLRMPKAVPLS